MPLNERELAFVHEYISNGGNATLAVLSIMPEKGYAVAADQGFKLLDRADVQESIASFTEGQRQTLTEAALMTATEKRKFLAQIVRTPISSIDEKSILAHEVTYNELGGVAKVKKLSPLDAIKIDNAMAGHDAPQQHNITSNGMGIDAILAGVMGITPHVVDVTSEQVEPGNPALLEDDGSDLFN